MPLLTNVTAETVMACGLKWLAGRTLNVRDDLLPKVTARAGARLVPAFEPTVPVAVPVEIPAPAAPVPEVECARPPDAAPATFQAPASTDPAPRGRGRPRKG